ncbi:MAG: VWA domain-containing protein [Dehalococcoidia bacterium]
MLAGVALAFVAATAGAQSDTPTVNLAGLTSDGTTQAQAVLTVLDGDGRPVTGLAQTDFDVLLNGSPATVTAVDRGVDSSLPIAVVLALDVSGSMEGGAIDQAKAAAGDFLAGLSPNDSVAILTFGSTVDLVLPFTRDRAAASAAVEGLSPEGSTALYQATDESVRLAATQGGRRAVVLLSDGLDNGSPLPREDALAAAGSLGVPVFAIGLGQDIDRDYLRELSDSSGGRFAETPSPEGLAQLYQDAGEQLRGQYIVTLDTSGANLVISEPIDLSLTVVVGGQPVATERAVCLQQLCVGLTELTASESGTRTFAADVISNDPVTGVSFLVDGVLAQELGEPPYEFTLETSALEEGEHRVSVEVATAGGTSEAAELLLQATAAGGGTNMLLFAAPVVILVVAVLVFLFLKRRRGPDQERELDPNNLVPPFRAKAAEEDANGRALLPDLDDRPPARVRPEEAMGHLLVLSGQLSGQLFPVGGSPLSIGSGVACTIQLSEQVGDEELIPPEHSRVWVRDGLLMVHEVRRLTVDGAEGGRWQKVASGEQLTIGPYALRFNLEGDASIAEAPEEVPGALRAFSARPDGLDSLRPAAEPGATNGDAASAPNGGQPAPAEGQLSPAPAPDDLPDIRRDPAPAPSGNDAPAFPLKRPAPQSHAQQPVENPDGVPNVLRDRGSAPRSADDAGGQIPSPDRPQQDA